MSVVMQRARQSPWSCVRSQSALSTEAGRGAGVVASSPSPTPRCFPGPVGGLMCYGPTGAVSRLWHGQQSRVATGLPSTATPDGKPGERDPRISSSRTGRSPLPARTSRLGWRTTRCFCGRLPLIPELAGFASLRPPCRERPVALCRRRRRRPGGQQSGWPADRHWEAAPGHQTVRPGAVPRRPSGY